MSEDDEENAGRNVDHALLVESVLLTQRMGILTLAMLDLFPANRGAASSVQSFVSLVCNAIIAGALAPAVAFSLPMLAGTTLALTLIGYLLWRRHLQVTAIEPHGTSDPQAYEPTDEM